ncbi:MAG TPA: hypothetical protein VLH75_16250 [Longimicrobiales bacterium]|nr:hypothetical protein [Longimicrobiales bacterium]
MRQTLKTFLVGSILLLGAGACADLDVVNPNDADAFRALASSGDVESLIAGGYNTIFNGVYSDAGPGLFLSNASFQHNAPWANSGMEHYGRIPRIALVNDASDTNYGYFTWPWFYSYRAIAAVSDGLRAIEANADLAEDIGATNLIRDKAFARLILGMAYGYLGITYDKAFIVDEKTDLSTTQEMKPGAEVVAAALKYLDEAITLAGQASFTLPYGWMQANVTSADLQRFAYSQKARFRAAAARTPTERAAVDWTAVIADVDKGVTSSFNQDMDPNNGWYAAVVDYGNYDGWQELSYWVYGMADRSGNYQKWLARPLGDKNPIISGNPVLIVTPDLRFPQGSTVDAQRANVGKYFSAPSNIADVWQRPARGTWRWSYYFNNRFQDYSNWADFTHAEINIVEMRMLKAEGLFRKGDLNGAAALINISRTANGLNATNAAGLNTSCVPTLPNGDCGGLLEMLKWEKRMEVQFQGLYGAPWYFDSRGWGDLYIGTPLQFPAPCKELQVLQLLPCYSFGATGGQSAAAMSSYKYPGES